MVSASPLENAINQNYEI